MKQYRFHRFASMLILELITRQLSHYAQLSHFALHYANRCVVALVDEFFFVVPGVTKGNEDAGGI